MKKETKEIIITEKDIINALKRYSKGEPIRNIGNSIGVSYETIRLWAKKAGIYKRCPIRKFDWNYIKNKL